MRNLSQFYFECYLSDYISGCYRKMVGFFVCPVADIVCFYDKSLVRRINQPVTCISWIWRRYCPRGPITQAIDGEVSLEGFHSGRASSGIQISTQYDGKVQLLYMRKNFIDLKQTGCVFVFVIQMCSCEIELFTSFQDFYITK